MNTGSGVGAKDIRKRKPRRHRKRRRRSARSAELYRALGLDFVEPELREDRGEFAAAEAHTLPDLDRARKPARHFSQPHHRQRRSQHARARWRRPRSELGLQYLGIADHSKASFQAHGLDEERLLAQIEEIRALNQNLGDGLPPLRRQRGRYSEGRHARFLRRSARATRLRVASVHNVFNLPEAEMTARIIRAIEIPHITMLGHLTGRLLLSREG